MRLLDLETFLAALGEGSLTGAARRLYVTQPAVSARLRRLEGEVGQPLLRRSRQGVRATAAGELLARRAGPLLEELGRLERELSGGGPPTGPLPIGATDLVATDHLPAVLRKFRRTHPRIALSLHVEGTAALLDLLREETIELALGTFPIPDDALEAIPLYRDPLTVLAPPDHPLAGRRRIDPERLAREVWIGHKPESVTRRQVEAFFAARGVRLRFGMEISNPAAIKALVQSRLGLAVLPVRSVRREIADGRLAALALRGFDLERISGLVVRPGAVLSPSGEALRGVLLSAALRSGQRRP